MTTFLQTATRVATELRRSNLVGSAKDAINDAINEAARERFYFNEMQTSFLTVAGQELYPDLGLVELDAVWYTAGGTRYEIEPEADFDIDDLNVGNSVGGPVQGISRFGDQFRLYPIPSSVITIYLKGYGRLTPYPLVLDASINAWLSEGENYIRALAKRNLLRDVIRDYGEARVYEGTAEDYKQQLQQQTTLRNSTGTIKGTQF